MQRDSKGLLRPVAISKFIQENHLNFHEAFIISRTLSSSELQNHSRTIMELQNREEVFHGGGECSSRPMTPTTTNQYLYPISTICAGPKGFYHFYYYSVVRDLFLDVQ